MTARIKSRLAVRQVNVRCMLFLSALSHINRGEHPADQETSYPWPRLIEAYLLLLSSTLGNRFEAFP
jgi:hypothetical protein